MRILRRTRPATAIGLLLACALLAALPAAASATGTPEVRGEWALKVESAKGTLEGTALITAEANGSGQFAASSVTWESQSGWAGTFIGTLEGSTASVETTSKEFGPVPAAMFESKKAMKVEEGVGTLALSGTGELTLGTEKNIPALETLTRIKSGKQMEKEQEEKEARANVRGEWSITLEGGGSTLKGIAIITEEASAGNLFASKSALFESAFGGTFSGKLKGAEAEVTITTDEVPGTLPPGAFTGTSIAVSSGSDPTSMTGTGMFKLGPDEFPSKLTATRIKTYQEVLAREKAEQEAKEKAEQEAKEKAEQEAKAKAEQEAKEKAEKEAKAKAEQEAKAKAEQEAKAKAEREAREKQEKEIVKVLALVSVEPTARTSTVSGASLLLALDSPNDYAVQGHLTLSFTEVGKSTGKHKAAKKKTVSLGSASFSLSSHGSDSVKVKLSQSARTELARHKTLHAILTVTTQSSGQPTTTKTFDVTLHAAKAAHAKH
jgi:hypothetical protein